LGGKINGQGMAVTRYLARLYAPTTALFYPDDKRGAITVITYDDEFLDHNDYQWPLDYGTHADWLEKLTENPRRLPKAIFLDITFIQARQDDTLDRLIATLCDIRHKKHIPVFLAALPQRHSGHLVLQDRLMEARSEDGLPCFTLAGVIHQPDPVDEVAWTYPLTLYVYEQQLHNHPPADSESPHF